MSDSRSNPSLRTLATATIGAAVGAILTVTVVEGTVSVHNPAGTVTASAGHTVTATPTTAPQLDLPPKAATPSVRGDDARLPDIATTVVELQAQNQQLRLKLQKAEEELALTDEVRTAEQGVALPFPSDLPARFAGDALQKAFEAALSEAGIEGGVLEVDCAEFPCVVFGQVSTRDDMDKLRRTQAFAPYSDDANNTSVWTATRDKDGTKVLESYFGVALLPQGDKPVGVQQKRLQRRVQEGYEHKYAPPHAE